MLCSNRERSLVLQLRRRHSPAPIKEKARQIPSGPKMITHSSTCRMRSLRASPPRANGSAMSILLTDAQTDAITNLAQPLTPPERAGFFAELFETLLMRRDEVGDGELGRLLRDLHCRHFRPPSDEEADFNRRVSRWQHKLTQPRNPKPRRARAANEFGP